MHLKTKVILVVAGLLLSVSVIGSIINYHKNIDATQSQLKNTSLPLSVDNIYTEIQQRMIEPLLVSSLMSHDTFLRDWILSGEKEIDGIVRYLREIQKKYDVFTTFLVSDKTKHYYHPRGLIDVVNPNNSSDAWFFRFIKQPEPYEINLDYNINLGDFLVMFINYKVMDYHNELIGVTGVGVRLVNIEEMLNSFKSRYKYDVYFVDQKGEIVLFSKALNKRGNINNIEGLKAIKERVYTKGETQFEYADKEGEYLLNTKYIEKLKLHLFVEINKKEYMTEIRKTFYMNLTISLLVTLMVIGIIIYTIHLYQQQLLKLASEDTLTGLANRRQFNDAFDKYFKMYRKGVNSLTLMLMDIDNFKEINDDFGHLIGDETLVRVAKILKTEFRSSDMIARWGGEEFAILLVDVPKEKATELAKRVCQSIRDDIGLQELLKRALTVSVGVGELSSVDSQDGLVYKVDKALYAAKELGKNQVVVL